MVIESWQLGALVAMLVGVAEFFHAQRAARVAHLAFGHAGPAAWTHVTPFLRTAALALIAFGFHALWTLPPAVQPVAGKPQKPARHHLVVALDVSPSMHLTDSGPRGDKRRSERARTLVASVLQRLDTSHTRTTIVAFYTDAKPVVTDTFDLEVLDNILDDLPLEYAFDPGKTDMYRGIEVAADIGRSWPPGTATLVVVSDGDTLPAKSLVKLPPAFVNTLVLGVGHPHKGQFIDGHSSRQNVRALQQLALRLGGSYHDGNELHVPTPVLTAATSSLAPPKQRDLGHRDLALAALASGSLILLLLAPLLALLGTPSSAPARRTRAASRTQLQAGATS